ncbi:MAG TPA: hypothetical protein VIF62_21855 [Labilithrix sp.]
MAGPGFDPNGAVRFDLKTGAASDAKGQRLLLVPSASIESLDDGAQAKLGADLGRACGARAQQRLGGESGARGASLEAVINQLAGELAIAGVGAVHLERWGRALIVVVTNPSVASDSFLGAAVAAAIGAIGGRDVLAAALGRDRGAARYFIGSAATANKVRGLVAQGRAYAEIVAALQGGAA